jgi:hypothetical protein
LDGVADVFECNLDNTTLKPCDNKIGYEKLNSGSHVFLARAVDLKGNHDEIPVKFRWMVSAASKG